MAPTSAAVQLELLGLKAKEAAHWRIGVQDEMLELDSNAIEGSREIREVWSWNLDEEFSALLGAVAGESGVMLALDMEFPGFVCAEPRVGARNVRYQALRENVDRLRPIQLGAAVASADGALRGVWTFNLRFDLENDLHTAASVAFLRAAGIDFPRHASEGIDAAVLGRRLTGSYLVGQHGRTPSWITFSGAYDLGYLLKLLTAGEPLPQEPAAFDSVLSAFCPRRHELRDQLPHGSLESLARRHGIKRYGAAHTAGSDALLTLELFLCILGVRGKARKWNQWQGDEWDNSSEMAWYASWDGNWGAQTRWEDHYNAFGFSPTSTAGNATGQSPMWMSQSLSSPGHSQSWAANLQTPLASLKATSPAIWPDASSVAAGMLKSGSWQFADSTAPASQVLAI